MESRSRAGARHVAGSVLVEGPSSRMGRDKALLPCGSRTLTEQIGDSVRQAAGNLTLRGDPEKYAPPGLPDFGRALIQSAWRSPQACVVCDGPNAIEPLCAVYHRRLLPALATLKDKRLKMNDFLLHPGLWPAAKASALRSVTTPVEWRREVA